MIVSFHPLLPAPLNMLSQHRLRFLAPARRHRLQNRGVLSIDPAQLLPAMPLPANRKDPDQQPRLRHQLEHPPIGRRMQQQGVKPQIRVDKPLHLRLIQPSLPALLKVYHQRFAVTQKPPQSLQMRPAHREPRRLPHGIHLNRLP